MTDAAMWLHADRGVRFRPPSLHVELRRSLARMGAGPGFGPPLHDWRLVAQSMYWGCNGRPSTLSLRYQLGGGPAGVERLRPEVAAEKVGVGDEVVLLVEAAQAGTRAARREEWFRGFVGQQHSVIQASPDYEALELTAYGPELRLAGQAVCGQWHKAAARDDQEINGQASAATARRSYVCSTGLPAVFNPDGRPNASGCEFRLASLYDSESLQSAGCRVFETPGREVRDSSGETVVCATHWTAYAAVRSLVEWVDDYQVISPQSDWDAIEDLLGQTVIGEVNVQGLSLLEALRAVLLPVGFGFALEPWAELSAVGSETTARRRHRLRVFALRGTAVTTVRLPMAPVERGRLPLSSRLGQQALVQRVDYLRDLHHVTNQVVVVGDRRRRQVILEFNYRTQGQGKRDLVPLWDPTEHDLADWAVDGVVDPTLWSATGSHTAAVFDRRYNKRGSEHHLYQHVFRTFVWNEDGAFCCLGHDLPDLGDFGVGDGTNFVRRPRPVGRSLLRDESTGRVRNFPARVQMGIDNEDLELTWLDVPEAVILPDRAGFTITRNVLAGAGEGETWRPYHGCLAKAADGQTLHEKYGHYTYLTLLHNTLRQDGLRLCMRLIGSVECDDATIAVEGRQVDSAWPFEATRVVYAPSRFKWRQVPEGTDLSLAPNRRDERDDAADALAYARAVRQACQQAVGHGSVVLRGLHRGYCPGLAVPSTSGRRVDFSVDGGGRAAYPVIVAVRYDFTEGVHKTELVLDSSLLALPG